MTRECSKDIPAVVTTAAQERRTDHIDGEAAGFEAATRFAKRGQHIGEKPAQHGLAARVSRAFGEHRLKRLGG